MSTARIGEARERIQGYLDMLVESGAERGMQLAIYHGSDLIVDAWAGVADAVTGRPVDGETLFTAFSATKGIVATLIHILVQRGTLEYDAPIARYWPEFGTHGKQRVTVLHALTHTAGIPHMPAGVNAADLCDWDSMCRAVAELRPLWQPGAYTGYHSLTMGWILGGVAERADGRSITHMVREEICNPLGISSLYLGVDDAADRRVARLESAPVLPGDPASSSFSAYTPEELSALAIPPALQPLEAIFSQPDVRRAVVPAAGGLLNARALARHYAALACGTLDGVQLLRPESIQKATALQTADADTVIGAPIRKASGYWLPGPYMLLQSAPAAFGHTGHGGTLGFADPAHRIAFGFTKNYIVTGPQHFHVAYQIAQEAYAALGIA